MPSVSRLCEGCSAVFSAACRVLTLGPRLPMRSGPVIEVERDIDWGLLGAQTLAPYLGRTQWDPGF